MLFKIYGKPNCGYCKKAAEILTDTDLTFDYYTVGVDVTKQELENKLQTEIKTVPVVLVDNNFIGGYTELCDYLIEEDIV